MGWTFFSDRSMNKQRLVRHLTSAAYWGSSFTVIKSSVAGNNLWQVVERTMDNGEKVRFIALDLLRSGGSDSGWGYKDLCESMGPCEVNCPLGFLDLAPEPDSEYAAGWRKEVRAWHEKQRVAARERRNLKRGDVLKLNDDLFELVQPLYSRNGKRIVSWLVTRIRDRHPFRMSLPVITRAIERTKAEAAPAADEPEPVQATLIPEAA